MSAIITPQQANFPRPFPAPWAAAWGEDEFGLWMTLQFKDSSAQQTFRWIEPGTFLMGSPETEPNREPFSEGSETQHLVTLTQGYWLADSACTQALWQVVMAENPAHFSEDMNNPVEQISWEDIQGFLAKLNSLVPGLQARVPSEAQWEYACRAGTQTVFSFGDTITPEQVNYHGDSPYAGGQVGLNRGKTVAVKSLPANPWGLYEMHGNVWEWCQDWYASYSAEATSYPLGSVSGPDRVLRGGSWDGRARDTRSAQRVIIQPDLRYPFIGFRLALGQTGQSQAD